MNRTETAALLTYCNALGDRIEITDDVIIAWHGLLADTNVKDANAAVDEHYKTTQYPIKPAAICSRVKATRLRRIELAEKDLYPPDNLPPWAFPAWKKAAYLAVGNGETVETAKAFALQQARQIQPPQAKAPLQINSSHEFIQELRRRMKQDSPTEPVGKPDTIRKPKP